MMEGEAIFVRNAAERWRIVSLPEDYSVRWPIFSKALEDIGDYSDANSKDAELSKAKFAATRTRYTHLSILHSTLVTSLNKDSNCKFNMSVPCSCDQSHLSLRKYLLVGLELDPHMEWMKSFGMTREFFTSHFQLPDKKPVKSAIDVELGLGVTKLCRSVLSFYGQEFTDKLLIPKICKLPDMLSEDYRDLCAQESSIERDKKTYLRHVDYYFESMMKGITLMCDKYDLQENGQAFFSSIAQFYAVKAEALSLKVKLLQLQILSETYDRETVSSLRSIKNHLKVSEGRLEQEMNEKSTLLESYERVGGVFQDLVKEYAALCVAIKNEKWAFQELQKSEQRE